MTADELLQSRCRPGSNWFVTAYDVWVFTVYLTARQIYVYVRIDQGIWF